LCRIGRRCHPPACCAAGPGRHGCQSTACGSWTRLPPLSAHFGHTDPQLHTPATSPHAWPSYLVLGHSMDAHQPAVVSPLAPVNCTIQPNVQMEEEGSDGKTESHLLGWNRPYQLTSSAGRVTIAFMISGTYCFTMALHSAGMTPSAPIACTQKSILVSPCKCRQPSWQCNHVCQQTQTKLRGRGWHLVDLCNLVNRANQQGSATVCNGLAPSLARRVRLGHCQPIHLELPVPLASDLAPAARIMPASDAFPDTRRSYLCQPKNRGLLFPCVDMSECMGPPGVLANKVGMVDAAKH